MDGSHQGVGQQHMHRPFYELQSQLLHQSGNVHSYAKGAVSMPGSSSGFLESSGISGYVPSTVAPRVPIIGHRSTISYRQIRPSDLEVLQEIHEALFPIKYEAEFFHNVVHGRGIISWAAVDSSRSDAQCDELVGFVTARIIAATDVEFVLCIDVNNIPHIKAGVAKDTRLNSKVGKPKQEMDMLNYEISKSERSLIYILTLGVVKPYRNSGIASALLWEVIEYANQISNCRAVYLHVIAYNRPAIMFYQKNMFQCLRRLHNFYSIEGQYHDAYLYVYYVNGGRSPCTAIDMLTAAIGYVRGFFTSLAAKLF